MRGASESLIELRHLKHIHIHKSYDASGLKIVITDYYFQANERKADTIITAINVELQDISRCAYRRRCPVIPSENSLLIPNKTWISSRRYHNRRHTIISFHLEVSYFIHP